MAKPLQTTQFQKVFFTFIACLHDIATGDRKTAKQEQPSNSTVCLSMDSSEKKNKRAEHRINFEEKITKILYNNIQTYKRKNKQAHMRTTCP